MYWDNCWLNNFNKTPFLEKTLFLEKIFFFLFSDKLFHNFFFKKITTKLLKFKFFKFFFLQKLYKKYFFRKNKPSCLENYPNFDEDPEIKHKKYNFTKLFIVKYNNCILISSFCFFFFKIKKKTISLNIKKGIPFNKAYRIFFKKKKGKNISKKKFFLKNYFLF